MPKFWVKFGPIWVIFKFSTKKRNRHFFPLPETRLCAKIQEIPMRGFQKKKNAKKLCFWAFWVKMGQIGPKRGHFRIFGEKVKTSPSFPICFIFQKQKIRKFQCVVSEKNWRTERDRQRDMTETCVYRSKSARWASDQKK